MYTEIFQREISRMAALAEGARNEGDYDAYEYYDGLLSKWIELQDAYDCLEAEGLI